MSKSKFIESIQFHYFKDKLFLLHFETESLECDRFRTEFKTDKYLDILQWEELFSKINKILKTTKDSTNWRNEKERGIIKVRGLFVEYTISDKDESYIDFKKLNYELDWFLKIRINRRTSAIEKWDEQALPCDATSQAANSSSCSNSNKRNQEAVNLDNFDDIIALSQSEIEKDVCSSSRKKYKRIKADNCDNDDSLVDLSNVPSKSPRKRRNIANQPKLDEWISASKEKYTNRSPIKKKNSTRGQTSKKIDQPSSTSNDFLLKNFIDDEQRKKMKDFLEKTNEEVKQSDQRRKELKHFKVIDFKNLEDSEMRRMIQSLSDDIRVAFIDAVQRGEPSLIINGSIITPCMVTTSNVFNEKQCLTALDEIQKILNGIQERPSNDDDYLHDVILPFVIIEIFKKAQKMTTNEAVSYIKMQNDYQTYFNKQIN